MKRKSTSWFTDTLGAIGGTVADLAVNIKEKTINAISLNENEDEKKIGEAQKELT